MIPWWSTDFGEDCVRRVTSAIRDKKISQGTITREFEERLAATLGVPYVACTTSGTTALTMALLAADIGMGDEVVVPNRTWIATAHAVMMTSASVGLQDVNARGLLDAEEVYRWAIEPNEWLRSAGAIPVNLNGRMAELPSVGTIIEDSCQAFPQPPRGLAACYSMSTAKLLPTGQGGFVATRDEGFYRECLSLRTHDVADAMVPQVLAWRRFGYNFRFTDIQAAIGLAQLDRIPDRIARLYEIDAMYRRDLPDYLEMLPRHVEDGPPLYAEVLYRESEDLRAYLRFHGVEARPFYPSLHTAPYLHVTGTFPNSERFSHGLTLPSGPSQTDDDIRRVIALLHEYRAVRYWPSRVNPTSKA